MPFTIYSSTVVHLGACDGYSTAAVSCPGRIICKHRLATPTHKLTAFKLWQIEPYNMHSWSTHIDARTLHATGFYYIYARQSGVLLFVSGHNDIILRVGDLY